MTAPGDRFEPSRPLPADWPRWVPGEPTYTPRPGHPFRVDDAGRVDGVPYVLPHRPGERAYGVRAGWYVLAPGEPDGVAGPFDSARDAEREHPTCAGCGEPFPCSNAGRTDLRGDVRARHHVAGGGQ